MKRYKLMLMKVLLLLVSISSLLLSQPTKQISLLDINLRIDGLVYWDENKPNLYRLPISKKSIFTGYLWRLGTMPSGGVISFKTDSQDFSIVLENPSASQSMNLTRIAKIGIDLYVNNEFCGNFTPNTKGKMEETISIKKPGVNSIKLYLPLYEKIKIKSILLGKKSKIFVAKKYDINLPIVFYGSSITQGASASSPSLSYPAIVSRKLDAELVNMGFSGMGLGQAEIIDVVSKIKASMFVIDFWANPNPKLYKERLPLLIKAIRSENKLVPIVVTSPIYNIGREKENYKKYNIGKKSVHKFQMAGDANIYFHDLYKDFNKEYSYYLIDGRHPNTLGMLKIADSLYPRLNMILNQEKIFNISK